MYQIAIIVSVLFLLLLYMARKEKVSREATLFLRPFHKMAMLLYRNAAKYCPGVFCSRQVVRDLCRLNPGEAEETLKAKYYANKMAVCLLVIFVGTIFGALVTRNAQEAVILHEDGRAARGSYREGVREIDVAADYEGRTMEFPLQIEPKVLSADEADALFEELTENLPEYILGSNESLDAVSSDLLLEESYEAYPFTLEWESSRPDILSSSGRVIALESRESVTLSVLLRYDEHDRKYEREHEIEVRVAPPVLTVEEQLYQEIQGLLSKAQSDSLEQEIWQLPTQWQGKSLSWRQKVADQGLLLWAAAVVAGGLVYLCADRDLHEQLKKRKKGLRQEYPEIVHKLVLFVEAGMTVRGAFGKIAEDYEAKEKKAGRLIPAYEEMLYTCRELRSGISEAGSYEHFGMRTGLQEYVRLSTLLIQNLKRGNAALPERLREEADKSAEERLQRSKKLGEEAGTKLLIPMVLMLGVVMVVIMMPVFMNM